MQPTHSTHVPAFPLVSGQSGRMTMSSLEVAELTGKRHAHVIRDIRNMLLQLGDTSPQFWGKVPSDGGRPMEVANLPKRECLILVSGYSVDLRARIVDRWIELEHGTRAKPASAGAKVTELATVFGACKKIARLAGFKGNSSILSAAQAARKITGTDPLALIDATHLKAEVQEQYLGPRQIGEREVPAISAQRVNKALETAGLQVEHRKRGKHAYWELTDAGKRAGGDYFDTGKKRGDGTPVRQVKWPATVIDRIRDHLQPAAA